MPSLLSGERSELREVLQSLTSCCDSRVRRSWQRANALVAGATWLSARPAAKSRENVGVFVFDFRELTSNRLFCRRFIGSIVIADHVEQASATRRRGEIIIR